jgi:branched-chain amino acid transport system permease protein
MEYLIHILIIIGIYSILAISLNLVVGYTGLLSITHAAFYGLGAYAGTIMLKGLGLSFLLSMFLSVIFTMIIGFFVGLVLSKLKNDYYVLGSFGFNIIIYSLFLNWQELTRGPLGIVGIPRPEIFGISFSKNIMFLILVIFLVSLIFLISEKITSSSFGRVLKGIRENEDVLQVFGYQTAYYKLTIFTIASGMAAMAGVLFATYINFIDPSSFTLMESIFILTIIILGGLAKNTGSLVGVAILILIPELLRFIGLPYETIGYTRQAIYGLLLLALMFYRPQGILGEYKI